jgi:predicted nucleic acid-binding protein
VIRQAVALDTNVLSEIMRTEPTPDVVRIVSELDDPSISAAAFHELAYGVARLPVGNRKSRMAAEIAAFFARSAPCSRRAASRILSIWESNW